MHNYEDDNFEFTKKLQLILNIKINEIINIADFNIDLQTLTNQNKIYNKIQQKLKNINVQEHIDQFVLWSYTKDFIFLIIVDTDFDNYEAVEQSKIEIIRNLQNPKVKINALNKHEYFILQFMTHYLDLYANVLNYSPKKILSIYEKCLPLINKMLENSGYENYYIVKFQSTYIMVLNQQKMYVDIYKIGKDLIQLRKQIANENKFKIILNSEQLLQEFQLFTFYIRVLYMQSWARQFPDLNCLKKCKRIIKKIQIFSQNINCNKKRVRFIQNKFYILQEKLSLFLQDNLKEGILQDVESYIYNDKSYDNNQLQTQIHSNNKMGEDQLSNYIQQQKINKIRKILNKDQNSQKSKKQILNDINYIKMETEYDQKFKTANVSFHKKQTSLKSLNVSIDKIITEHINDIQQTGLVQQTTKKQRPSTAQKKNQEVQFKQSINGQRPQTANLSPQNEPKQNNKEIFIRPQNQNKINQTQRNLFINSQSQLKNVYKQKNKQSSISSGKMKLMWHNSTDSYGTHMIELLTRPSTSTSTLPNSPTYKLQTQPIFLQEKQEQQIQILSKPIKNLKEVLKNCESITQLKERHKFLIGPQSYLDKYTTPQGETQTPLHLIRTMSNNQLKHLTIIKNEVPVKLEEEKKLDKQVEKNIIKHKNESSILSKGQLVSGTSSEDYIGSQESSISKEGEEEFKKLIQTNETLAQLVQASQNNRQETSPTKDILIQKKNELHPQLYEELVKNEYSNSQARRGSIFKVFRDKKNGTAIMKSGDIEFRMVQGKEDNMKDAIQNIEKEKTKKNYDKRRKNVFIAKFVTKAKEHKSTKDQKSKILSKNSIQEVVEDSDSHQEQIYATQNRIEKNLTEKVPEEPTETQKIIGLMRISSRLSQLIRDKRKAKRKAANFQHEEIKHMHPQRQEQIINVGLKKQKSYIPQNNKKSIDYIRNLVSPSLKPKRSTFTDVMDKVVLLRNVSFKLKYQLAGGSQGAEQLAKKKYPPFHFMSTINGEQLHLKVKYQFTQNQQMMSIVSGHFFKYSINLDEFLFNINQEKIKEQFGTVWPFLFLAFTSYLDSIKKSFKDHDLDNHYYLKDLPPKLSFFDTSNDLLKQKLKEYLTDTDIYFIGKLKDTIQMFLQFFFFFKRKINGLCLRISNNDQYNEMTTIPLKIIKKQIIRFHSTNNFIYFESNYKNKVFIKQIKNFNTSFCHLATNDYRIKQIQQHFEEQWIESLDFLEQKIKLLNNTIYYLCCYILQKRKLKFIISIYLNFYSFKEYENNISQNKQIDLSDFQFTIQAQNSKNFDQKIQDLNVQCSDFWQICTEKDFFLREIYNFIFFKQFSKFFIKKLIKSFQKIVRIEIKEQEKNQYKLFLKNINSLTQKQKKAEKNFTQIKGKDHSHNQVPTMFSDQIQKDHVKYDMFFQKEYKNIKIKYMILQNHDLRQILNTEDSNFSEDNDDQDIEEGYLVPGIMELDNDEQEKHQLLALANNKFQRQSTKKITYIEDINEHINYLLTYLHLPRYPLLIQFAQMHRMYQLKPIIHKYGEQIQLVFQIYEVTRNNQLFYRNLTKKQIQLFIFTMQLYMENQYLDKNQKRKLTIKILQNFFTDKKNFYGSQIILRNIINNFEYKPLLLDSLQSLKDHLIAKTPSLCKYFYKLKYQQVMNFSSLNKCLVQVFTYFIKQESQIYQNPFIFLIIIIPINSKSQEYKLILNTQDLQFINHSIYNLFFRYGYKEQYCFQLLNHLHLLIHMVPKQNGRDMMITQEHYFPQIKKRDGIGLIRFQRQGTQLNMKKSIKQQEQKNLKKEDKIKLYKKKIDIMKMMRIRFHKHQFQFEQKKQQQSFCEGFVKRYRKIIIQIQKFNDHSFIIYTVYKDMFLEKWVIQIYIPTSGRTLIAFLYHKDVEDSVTVKFQKYIKKKHIFFFKNPNMTYFQNYDIFIKRILVKNCDHIEGLQTVNFSPKFQINPNSSNQIPSNQNQFKNNKPKFNANSNKKPTWFKQKSKNIQNNILSTLGMFKPKNIIPAQKSEPQSPLRKIQTRLSIQQIKKRQSQSEITLSTIQLPKQGVVFNKMTLQKTNARPSLPHIHLQEIKQPNSDKKRQSVEAVILSFGTQEKQPLQKQSIVPNILDSFSKIAIIRKQFIQYAKKQKKEIQKYKKRLSIKNFQNLVTMHKANKEKHITQNINKYLFKISKYLDINFQEDLSQSRLPDLHVEKFIRYIEVHIWSALLKDAKMVAEGSCPDKIILDIAGIRLNLAESIIFDQNEVIDKNNEINISISIDLPMSKVEKIPSYQSKLGNMNNNFLSLQEIKQKIVDFYFMPIDFIPYTFMSEFNFFVKIFSFNSAEQKSSLINVREIMNFYIAEGFYRIKSDFVNSKINYSDLRSISMYLAFKVKGNNFMEMMDQQKIKSIFTDSEDESDTNEGQDDNYDSGISKKNVKRLSKYNKIYKYEELVDMNNRLILKTQFFTMDSTFKFDIYQIGTHKAVQNTYKKFKYFEDIHPKFKVIKDTLKYNLLMKEVSNQMTHIMIEFFNVQYNFNLINFQNQEQENLICDFKQEDTEPKKLIQDQKQSMKIPQQLRQIEERSQPSFSSNDDISNNSL